MASKDRNLHMTESDAQGNNIGATAVEVDRGEVSGRRRAHGRQNNTWLMLLLLGNLLLLVATAWWLSSRIDDLSAHLDALMQHNEAAGAQQDRSDERLELAVRNLGEQYRQPIVQLQNQQRELASAVLDVVQSVGDLQAAVSRAAASGQTVSDPPADVPTRWVVNVSTITDPAAMADFSRQVAALGYTLERSEAGPPQSGESKVQIVGFADRQSAELAARQIMRQTAVSGLWVWQEK